MAGSGNSVLFSDLATEVLALFGSYVSGETIAAADSQSLIFTFNGILDGYSAEFLAVFNSSVTSGYSLSANKQTYTLGASGSDWVLSVVPPYITRLGAMISASVEIPLRILTDPEWAAVPLKSQTSTIPQAVWIQNTPPTVTFSFWPVPSATIPVKIYGGQQVAARVAATSDVLVLPAGYQELLTYELAIKAAPKFGANLPAWIYTAWQQSKTRVKESNYEAYISRPDTGLEVARGSVPAERLAFYTGS